MTKAVPIAMSEQEARDIVASQEKKIERLEVMIATRDQQIEKLQRKLREASQ